MCLGHTHALSGLVTGTAAGEFVLHLPPSGTAPLAALCAGFACLPDLDTRHSCAARSLGFMSEAFAWSVAKISGGHRHGTHSALGVAVFTTLAWLACHYRTDTAGRLTLGAFLALAIAAGLRALRLGGHAADLLAIGAAAGIAWYGWGLALIPLACGLGCATHLAGDALTDEGIPLLWPLSLKHYKLWPEPLSFTTGSRPERWIIAPALLLALGLLAWHAVTLPGYLTALAR